MTQLIYQELGDIKIDGQVHKGVIINETPWLVITGDWVNMLPSKIEIINRLDGKLVTNDCLRDKWEELLERISTPIKFLITKEIEEYAKKKNIDLEKQYIPGYMIAPANELIRACTKEW